MLGNPITMCAPGLRRELKASTIFIEIAKVLEDVKGGDQIEAPSLKALGSQNFKESPRCNLRRPTEKVPAAPSSKPTPAG